MKLSKFEAKRDSGMVLSIPVKANFQGSYDLALAHSQLIELNKMVASGKATLSYISPTSAVYYLAPEPTKSNRNEALMFDIFKTDPDPVTTHFVEDTMIVTVQRNYNSKQRNHLAGWLAVKTKGAVDVTLATCEKPCITCLHVTFKSASNFQQNQARVKSLADMFVHRIPARPEPKPIVRQQLSLF